MSYRQYILENKFMLHRESQTKAFDAIIKEIQLVRSVNSRAWRDGLPKLETIREAFELFGFDAIENEIHDICDLDILSDSQDAHQMLLFEAIAPFVEPGSYITMMGDDQHLWQWFFDNGEIYTREVATVGIITSPEDRDRKKDSREPEVGYRYCECRDCFELVVGKPGEYCYECIEAGCPDYQGKEGMSQECLAGDAYSE